MQEALRAARRLALLGYDAETLEDRARRHDYFIWRQRLQAQARLVERLTHALGVKEEAAQGGHDDRS